MYLFISKFVEENNFIINNYILMGLSKSFADMKQLKRDLYGPPPRTRVTDTFK
jgi:hypothetical protein